MRAMLDADHADRRQLSDLMATEPPAGMPLLVAELAPASTTRCRVVIDDLIDLILGLELAPSTRMPALPARATLLAFTTHQFLGLRTRLRTPLRPRLGGIRGRWPRARARVLARLLLQSLQTILVLSKPIREINDELDTRITPRVINRLRLRALHARNIRCTKQESLPLAPTTERLRGIRAIGGHVRGCYTKVDPAC